jgi:hypothetical protein
MAIGAVPEPKGEPASGVNVPFAGLMENPEMLLSLEFAAYANLPPGSTVRASGSFPAKA